MEIEVYREAYDQMLGVSLPPGASDVVIKGTDSYGNVRDIDREDSTDNPNIAEFILPFVLRQYDGEVGIFVSFTVDDAPYYINKTIRVVTPFFAVGDLPREFRNSSKYDIEHLETLVRHIIAAYTGIMFGHKKKNPENRHGAFHYNSIGEVTYYPYSDFGEYPPSEATYEPKTDTYFIAQRQRRRGAKKTLDHEYLTIPEDVIQAALAIANVLGCKEETWRDRYIEVMTSSNWRIQYHEGAFSSTGSLHADQLLSKYRYDLGGSAWI